MERRNAEFHSFTLLLRYKSGALYKDVNKN